ncbi:protein FRA10AC1 homolog [Euwallacea fornicatus]|uniref:protein FRA10AC1 homolog n=1 Tax=Euwallacea fornicatus TaxID=995702 RepID=UPI0033901A74
MSSLRTQMRYLNPFELHKLLINDYVLKHPGDTKLFQRDKSKDRNDYHVLKDNHRFLWDDTEPDTWEEQFAKKYYEKLFKEYCIADLSLYKENKVALRWRVEKEVVSGKGQFMCGNKHCTEKGDLRSWEVNFAYLEKGEKKNVLVKIRLCPTCSKKLNYHSKKREVTRLKKKEKNRTKKKDIKELNSSVESRDKTETSELMKETAGPSRLSQSLDESPWEEHKPVEVKSREEEMEDYLQDLLI